MIYVYANLVYYSLFMVNLLMLWAFVVLILNAIRLSQIILS